MPRRTAVGLIVGIFSFAIIWGAVRWAILKSPGVAPLALEALGWILIIGIAAWVTRGWVAPILVAGAGVLMTAGESVLNRLGSSHNDKELALGVSLSPLMSLFGIGLLIGAVALILMSLSRSRRG
jgi:hypothetical protein